MFFVGVWTLPSLPEARLRDTQLVAARLEWNPHSWQIWADNMKYAANIILSASPAAPRETDTVIQAACAIYCHIICLRPASKDTWLMADRSAWAWNPRRQQIWTDSMQYAAYVTLSAMAFLVGVCPLHEYASLMATRSVWNPGR